MKDFTGDPVRKKKLVKKQNENSPVKKTKKIKIRLADANIPDSYICEIYDSSLDEYESDNEFNYSKPTDYFDILMSNNKRRSSIINTSVENEKIPEKNKFLKEIEDDDVLRKRKLDKERNKRRLKELVNKRKRIESGGSSSSDDESLFQIQTKLQFSKQEENSNNTNGSIQSVNKENKEIGRNVPRSNVVDLFPKRKDPNILNYFSKLTADNRKTDVADPIKSESEVEVVDEDEKRTDKVKVKLAPLFQKRIKAVVDPQAWQAKLDFLHNGVPNNARKVINSQNDFKDALFKFLFPAISHVQQKDEDPLWVSHSSSVPLLPENHYNFVPKMFRFPIKSDTKPVYETIDIEENALSDLQFKYKDLDMQSIIKGLKRKKNDYVKQFEKSYNSHVGTENVETVDDGEGFNSLWTEIYKPKSHEIMGNKSTVAKLSGWLKTWKEFDDEVRKLKKSETVAKASDDESDVFLLSDDESLGLKVPVNVCVLSGPIASGKTSLVYALASELDFNVFEVNASSKRTGKKLMLDLQEATKSHQVIRGFNLLSGNDNLKLRKSKRPRIKKKKTMETQKNNKISLILIEDADIFFEEHDEGFVSAITTLVQSSKRPFIFLSNENHYRYLERLKLQQAMLLKMTRPSVDDACALLDTIATLEGAAVKKEHIQVLVEDNGYDVRKSIHELQFWTSLRRTLAKPVETLLDLGKLWWGLNKFLYNEENVHHVKSNYLKRNRSGDLNDINSVENTSESVKLNVDNAKNNMEKRSDPAIHAYSEILDFVSVSDLFELDHGLEPIPRPEPRPRDSLSLDECLEPADWKVKELSRMVAEDLLTISLNIFKRQYGNRSFELRSAPQDELRWRKIQNDAKKDLLALVPSSSNYTKQALHTDYLSILRNMCRTERSRYLGNTKRKNRFLHYFRTIGIEPRDESLDISCDVLEN